MAEQISRQSKQSANAQMSVVGYIIGAGVALLLLPVLPFVIAVYAWRELTSDDGVATTGNEASSPVE